MASFRSKTSSYITVPLFLAAFLAIGVIGSFAVSPHNRRNLKYGVSMVNVVNEFPHDPEAFTQGLLYFENDTLYESTGIFGRVRSVMDEVIVYPPKVNWLVDIIGIHFFKECAHDLVKIR